MKKTLSLLFALTVTASVVFAGDKDEPSALGVGVMQSGSIVKLLYKSDEAGTVKVTIYDNTGRQIFHENFAKIDAFMRPYNFSTMAEGTYTIEVRSEKGTQIKTLNYKKAGTADSGLVNVVKVNSAENKYLLTVANKAENTIYVRIYNSDNNLLYDGTEKISGDFAKLYNIKSSVARNLTFEVSDNSGTVKRIKY